MSTPDGLLSAAAARQHGVFALSQAESFGIAASTIRSRASAGRYERLHRSVYGMAGTASAWEKEVMALVLSVPQLSAASHKTAAYLWGMSTIRPEPAEIVAMRHLRAKQRQPMIHESLDLMPRDIVPVDAIPTTTACRTIRPLVEERVGWGSVTESALEDLFRRLVARSALPRPVEQFELVDKGRFVCRADFAYPHKRVLIELDSETFHMDRLAFQRDRAKQNRAHALAWVVYRFTWRQLQDDPASVLAVLAAAIAL